MIFRARKKIIMIIIAMKISNNEMCFFITTISHAKISFPLSQLPKYLKPMIITQNPVIFCYKLNSKPVYDKDKGGSR